MKPPDDVEITTDAVLGKCCQLVWEDVEFVFRTQMLLFKETNLIGNIVSCCF